MALQRRVRGMRGCIVSQQDDVATLSATARTIADARLIGSGSSIGPTSDTPHE
jgi:hypothetical protein